MAMIVNGWASFHLVTAVQQIFTCTTEAERAPFEGSDYRALLTSLTHLKQNETHPFWTALNSGNGPQTLEQARQAYRQARTKQSDEMQPLLASV
jgi:hypothetical protein